MYDLNKFCRLCLTERGVEMKLFDDVSGNCKIPLSEMVMRCVPVQIEMGDGLPAFLCNTCADLVVKIWKLKAISEHVDMSLRKLLGNSNALTDWEDEIKSIVKETTSLASRTRNYKNKMLEKPPSASLNTASETQFCNEALHNAELNPELNSDYDWPETGLSPDSPTSPQSPISGKEDESLPVLKNKRKLLKGDYTCEFCGRKYARSSHLSQHELTHTAEKPFQCSDCGKSFWYRASLIGHIKQTHTGDVNYSCEICGKGFFKKTELTRHKPTHSNETPHKCPQCGLGFKISKTLKRHIRNVHNAQRTHVCHACGKSFIQLQTLKVHMVLHSGVKPYQCSYCGKGFAQSAPLKTHMRIHTGEKPYTCHVCQVAFSTRGALTSHTLSHKNVLPYPCTRCERSFRLKKDLVCHEQGHDDMEVRLKQFPEIKEEGSDHSDGIDQLPNQLQPSQESQDIDPVEAVCEPIPLFGTFQETIPVQSESVSLSHSIGSPSNSMLPQLSLSNTLSGSSQLHDPLMISFSTRHVDIFS